MNLENQALSPYDISNYKGVRDKNFFEEDSVLKDCLKRFTNNYNPLHNQDMLNHLSGYGKLCGSILDELTEASHKEGKYGEIVKYDKTGNRIDEIRYSPEQIQSRKISYEYGIVNLDFHPEWKHPFTIIHKMSLAYIANMNGEGGVTCPVAMTDGMIQALKGLGTEEQKRKYLQIVAHPDSKSYFMAGQYVTERVGGSNVGANRTIAKKLQNGKWTLIGEKWFCSNPGDLWVTTARVEGTNIIGMFLVPRIKDNGELNGHHLLRKKDIIGSRGKVTAEIIYENVEAEELGRVGHGLANLMQYVIKVSRIHVSAAALGMSFRAFLEAREYTKFREAYGKKIGQFGSVKKKLSEMRTKHTALLLSILKNYYCIENKNILENLYTPVLKYISTVTSSELTHEAMMILGGNGILGDFSCLPRLHNDSIINETWEGTHNIIAGHALHSIHRNKIREAFFSEINSAINKFRAKEPDHTQFLKNSLDELEGYLSRSDSWQEENGLAICDLIYRCLSVSELLEQAGFSQNSYSFYNDSTEIIKYLFCNQNYSMQDIGFPDLISEY